MRMLLAVLLFITLGSVGFLFWQYLTPDLDTGQILTENNCGVCHDLSPASQVKKGPPLWRVFERKAGTVKAFRYSTAFLQSVETHPFRWHERNLTAFIEDPNRFIPNTSMIQKQSRHELSFEGVTEDANRRDIVAYLKSLR
ncbi:MAG: c-type cytochrome [Magnetococcales bacterium]|nr:c-type cytochrome [Magnetococcales bacterium]